MIEKILVINPNSNKEVTDAIDRALGPLRTSDAPAIKCITIAEGPQGIESQYDSDMAAPHVTQVILANATEFSAFVIACYSDPGLRSTREKIDKPVFGIAETGIATAISLGGNIGVISILAGAVERHWYYARSLKLDSQIIADIAIDLSVAELSEEEAASAKILDAGMRLRDEFGAKTILLGCAGMARYRQLLTKELNIIVIDPTQAAVAAAIMSLRLGYKIGK